MDSLWEFIAMGKERGGGSVDKGLGTVGGMRNGFEG